MSALVSIVVAAFNASKYIDFTIKSILSQSYVDFELIVVDDGSSDNTSEIVLNYLELDSRVRYIYQENSGTCSVPRNKGFAASNGKYVTFFDADDIMSQGKIARQVAFLEAHQDVAAVFCDYQNFTASGKYINTHFETCKKLLYFFNKKKSCSCCGSYILDPNESVDILIDENFTIACSPMFKSSFFKLLGGYDSSLSASEDWFLHMLVCSRYRIALDSFVGFQRRVHDLNMSHNHHRILEYKAISRRMAANIVSNEYYKARLFNLSCNYYYDLSLIYSTKSILLGIKYFKEGFLINKKIDFASICIIFKILSSFMSNFYHVKK